VIHEQAVEDVVAKVCTLFPAELQPTCTSLVDTFGPLVIEALENKLGADGACRKMEFCSSWPQCQLFPLPKESKPADAKFSQRYEEMVRSQYARMAGVSPWDWIKEQLERTFKTHLPLYDEDGDNFGASSLGPFRGSDWRGADCHDGDAQVYPGRGEPKRDDPFTDHNCNGIKGINIRGQSYEELLCGSTPGRGLILLSDSQGAHFRIPDHWMNASAINEDTYKHALFALENELDWPHLGAYTGHTTDQTGDTPGPVDSLYLRLYQRNHCNKANVQNIGVNGARIQTVVEELLPTMHINKTDSPALVFISLVGNDVCRRYAICFSFCFLLFRSSVLMMVVF
jgi:acyloxyacyl hydrolase